MTSLVRIQKWLAQAGYGSRRALEQQIRLGLVRVDGQIATLGQRIVGNEHIELEGQALSPEHLAPHLLLYHKPIGQICTRLDPQQRATVYTCLPPMKSGKWLLVGRLDIQTSGLLLVTNHGAIAHYLMHPSHQLEREYWVKLKGSLTPPKIQALLKGVVVQGELLKFKALHVEQSKDDKIWCRVILQTGRYHEVRRLFASQQLLVMRLKRIRFGSYQLPEQLAPKQFQYLALSEPLKQLINAAKY